jgi:hypothetical protein
MNVHVTASTAKTVVIWREGELFHARAMDAAGDEQVCLGVDLFEVIAELAALKLEDDDQAAEALELAENARAKLLLSSASDDADDDGYGDELSADGVT